MYAIQVFYLLFAKSLKSNSLQIFVIIKSPTLANATSKQVI